MFDKIIIETEPKWPPIFVNNSIRISNEISFQFVPNIPGNNKPVLAPIVAWHWIGDKSLSEPIIA